MVIEIHIKAHGEYVDTKRNYSKDCNYNEIALAITRLEELKQDLLELADSCKPEFKIDEEEE